MLLSFCNNLIMLKSNPTLPRTLRVLAWFAIVVTILLALLGILGPELGENLRLVGLELRFDAINQYVSYPWYLRVLVIGVPAAAMAYALARLVLLLGHAARGQVFSAPASGHLRSFGLWLLLSTLADILLPVPTQVMNHLLQASETFEFSLTFDTEVVWKVFFSTLVMLLARVLSDAYQLAEENRQFV